MSGLTPAAEKRQRRDSPQPRAGRDARPYGEILCVVQGFYELVVQRGLTPATQRRQAGRLSHWKFFASCKGFANPATQLDP
jgi:hypothetical protein